MVVCRIRATRAVKGKLILMWSKISSLITLLDQDQIESLPPTQENLASVWNEKSEQVSAYIWYMTVAGMLL